MAVPNGAEAKLYWSVAGNLVINVMGLRVTGSPTFNQALADQVGGGLKTAFSANLAARIAAGNQLVKVGIRDLRTDNQPEFRDTGAAVPGTAVGDPLPAQVALCITKRTARAGKSFRGRWYQGGFAEASNGTTGLASQADADSTLSFLQQMTTSLATIGVPAVVTKPQEQVVITETTTHGDGTVTTRILSRQTAKPGNTEPITAYESRNLAWETQRRRNNGRGALPSGLFNSTVVSSSS